MRSEAFFEDIDAFVLRSPAPSGRATDGDRLDRVLRAAPLLAGLLCAVAAIGTLVL